MVDTALPRHGTSFVGRAKDLDALHAAIAGGQRLLSLTGLGGIGKSRLALAFAGELLERGAFARGWFVALESEADPHGVPARIAAAIGVDGDGADVIEALAGAIGEERWLLVLDGLDGHAEVGPLVLRLLAAGRQLGVVTTSREDLGIEGARSYPLAGLGLPQVGAGVGDLEDHDAVQLFVQRARRGDLRFAATPENGTAILEVCRLVDGLPLAIELAAAWLRVMPVEEVAGEIRAGIDILTSTSRNVLERHRSLRAVLDHSWRLLTPDEIEAMAALAVTRGSFTGEAARDIAGAGPARLASLLAGSLLRVDAAGRYGFHPLVHRFAEEKLDERRALKEEAELRHGGFVLAYVTNSVGRDDELARLDAEIANVAAGMQRAHGRGDAAMLVTLMRLLAVDGAYYGARGHTPLSIELLEAAIGAAKATGELLVAHRLLGKLGNHHKLHHGELDLALAAYRASLALAEQLEDHHRQVVSLSVIGQARFEQGADDADGYLGRALALARAHDDALGLNHVLQHQGMLAGERGDWRLARARLLEALDALEAGGEARSDRPVDAAYQQFMTLLNLGETERMLGDLDRAMQLRQRALAMAESRDNDLWRAYALQEIGETLHGSGDRSAAQARFDQALELWTRHGVAMKARRLRALMTALGYATP